MWRKPCLMAFAVIALIVAGDANAQPVTVNKGAVKLERKTFDPANPPKPGPPLKEREIAACEYVFKIDVAFRFTPIAFQPAAGGGVRGSVRVDAVTITLSVPATIWLPTGVDEHVRAHEEGHLSIVQAVYKEADGHAKAAGLAVVKMTFEAEGKDKNLAVQEALRKAAVQVSDQYLAAVKGPCDEVEAAFDKVTDNSRNREVASEKAVADVLGKWRKGK